MKTITDKSKTKERTSPRMFIGRCWGKFFWFVSPVLNNYVHATELFVQWMQVK